MKKQYYCLTDQQVLYLNQYLKGGFSLQIELSEHKRAQKVKKIGEEYVSDYNQKPIKKIKTNESQRAQTVQQSVKNEKSKGRQKSQLDMNMGKKQSFKAQGEKAQLQSQLKTEGLFSRRARKTKPTQAYLSYHNEQSVKKPKSRSRGNFSTGSSLKRSQNVLNNKEEQRIEQIQPPQPVEKNSGLAVGEIEGENISAKGQGEKGNQQRSKQQQEQDSHQQEQFLVRYRSRFNKLLKLRSIQYILSTNQHLQKIVSQLRNKLNLNIDGHFQTIQQLKSYIKEIISSSSAKVLQPFQSLDEHSKTERIFYSSLRHLFLQQQQPQSLSSAKSYQQSEKQQKNSKRSEFIFDKPPSNQNPYDAEMEQFFDDPQLVESFCLMMSYNQKHQGRPDLIEKRERQRMEGRLDDDYAGSEEDEQSYQGYEQTQERQRDEINEEYPEQQQEQQQAPAHLPSINSLIDNNYESMMNIGGLQPQRRSQSSLQRSDSQIHQHENHESQNANDLFSKSGQADNDLVIVVDKSEKLEQQQQAMEMKDCEHIIKDRQISMEGQNKVEGVTAGDNNGGGVINRGEKKKRGRKPKVVGINEDGKEVTQTKTKKIAKSQKIKAGESKPLQEENAKEEEKEAVSSDKKVSKKQSKPTTDKINSQNQQPTKKPAKFSKLLFKSPILIRERQKLFHDIQQLTPVSMQSFVEFALKVLPQRCLQPNSSSEQGNDSLMDDSSANNDERSDQSDDYVYEIKKIFDLKYASRNNYLALRGFVNLKLKEQQQEKESQETIGVGSGGKVGVIGGNSADDRQGMMEDQSRHQND